MFETVATQSGSVATREEAVRAAFIRRVYTHLLGAVGLFIIVETGLFTWGIAKGLADFISGNRGAWLLLLGGFMVINLMATMAAANIANTNIQYAGLAGVAFAEALIFAPFLYFVFHREGGGATVADAAVITIVGFIGLSVVAMVTRKDLSVIRPMLMWGGVVALVLILGAVAFGLNLGVWFSVGMIALAGGSILYQTQQIMRRYPETAYVGAAVQLFGSLMTMFWYVLRLLNSRR